jgi:hypothetical protein
MSGKYRLSVANRSFSESQQFGQVLPPKCRPFLCKTLKTLMCQAICRANLPSTDPQEGGLTLFHGDGLTLTMSEGRPGPGGYLFHGANFSATKDGGPLGCSSRLP